MRKSILFLMVVIMALTLMGGLALAGGWTTISYTLTHDPNDTIVPNGTAIWNPSQTSPRSPHGYFSSSSNKCRVCHAVHEADSNSWRLLAATSKVTECDVCHGTTGLTLKRPYGTKSYTTIRGEHTLTGGAINIPDATVTTSLANGLGCNNCHSVHGANSLIGFGASDTAGWDASILRRDPNGDTQNLAIGPTAVGEADSSTVDTNVDAKRSNFCADCHNKNPNWDPDLDNTRPNGTSHVQGTGADGSLEVNSITITVAWGANSPVTGCTGCHSAPDTGNLWGSGDTSSSSSAFPHQTKGAKLLADQFTLGGSATAVNDATRVIPNMDQVCGSCHSQDGALPGAGAGGVGISF